MGHTARFRRDGNARACRDASGGMGRKTKACRRRDARLRRRTIESRRSGHNRHYQGGRAEAASVKRGRKMGCGLCFRRRKGSQSSQTAVAWQRVNGGGDARSVFSRSCARQMIAGLALLLLMCRKKEEGEL